MTPRSVGRHRSRLDGNMGVRKSNLNINNLWWDLCSWLWNWTRIRRVDSGLGSAQGESSHSWLYLLFCKSLWFQSIVHWKGSSVWKRSIHSLTSLQTDSSSTEVYKLGSVSLLFEDSSRSVKANCFAASANICMLLSSLLYPCHSKCFSFSTVYRNGRATPPLSIRRNQIYSGLSTRLAGTICLKQTLRALVCHWPVSTNIILSSPIVGRHCFPNAIDENNHIWLVLMQSLPLSFERMMNFPPSFICSSAPAQTRWWYCDGFTEILLLTSTTL